MANLIVEQEDLGRQIVALERATVSIGRGADNDICLRQHGVSRHHARLQHKPQGWLLTDLGSTNGTYVNGRQILEQEAYVLQPGDRIEVGSALLVFQQEDAIAVSREDYLPPRDRQDIPRKRGRFHARALAIAGAVVLVLVLVGIVFLLVTVLRPADALPTATAVAPLEHMMTALPTGFEDIVTSVVPLIPTGLSIPWLGGTPTPTP